MQIRQIVVLMATMVIVSASEYSPSEATRINLFNSMARSGDPSRSTMCFTYYIPLIDEIAKTYQREHDACLKDSREGRSKADAATLAKQLALAASANSSCELLKYCGSIKSAESLFECYAVGGSENAKSMYEINLNSTDHLTDLREEFRLVENKEFKCTNETKRKYEKDSTTAYSDFNKCNMGLIDVPKPTEPPKIVETTSTTAIPQSSTAAPVEIPQSSTAAPVLIPQSSTAAPVVIPQSSTAAPVVIPQSSTAAPVEIPQSSTAAPVEIPQSSTAAAVEIPQSSTAAPVEIPQSSSEAPLSPVVTSEPKTPDNPLAPK